MRARLILAAFLLVSMHAAEIYPETGRGPSMRPTFPDGKTVHMLVERVPFEALRAGDVVVFRHSRWGKITHRVFKQVHDERGRLVWWSKGDGNRLPDDEYVTPENYLGRVAIVLDVATN